MKSPQRLSEKFTLGTSLGQIFPDNPFGLFTVCTKHKLYAHFTAIIFLTHDFEPCSTWTETDDNSAVECGRLLAVARTELRTDLCPGLPVCWSLCCQGISMCFVKCFVNCGSLVCPMLCHRLPGSQDFLRAE